MRLALSTLFLALALRATGQTSNPDDPTGASCDLPPFEGTHEPREAGAES